MDFRDLGSSAQNYLKVVFVVHFILATWGIQGFWSPDSYLFYNFLLLTTVLWSMHAKENAEPIQMAMTINLVSIFLDIVVLSTYFPSSAGWSSERFSAGMAIMNLLARPVTTYVMSRNCSQRLGLDTDNFAGIFGAAGNTPRSRYDDIDSAGGPN